MKIVRKIHESQRQKKNLDCLYEIHAPGSTVGKISPTTSVIKEPNRQEMRVRNSEIEKFGTKNERDTELGQNIERRPKGYSADIPVSDTKFLAEVSPRNLNERWTTDPNLNLPREMIVLEAETQEQSDSD